MLLTVHDMLFYSTKHTLTSGNAGTLLLINTVRRINHKQTRTINKNVVYLLQKMHAVVAIKCMVIKVEVTSQTNTQSVSYITHLFICSLSNDNKVS